MATTHRTCVHGLTLSLAGAVGLALALSGRAAEAQDSADAVPRTGRSERRGTWIPHLRLHAGAPQKASLAVGALRVVRSSSDGTVDAGPLLVTEPGLRAGKVRVGYGTSGSFAAGYSVTAAYLRAWGRRGGGGGSRWTSPARDHAGAELHASFMFLDAGVGVYHPVRGRGGARTALSAGLGF